MDIKIHSFAKDKVKKQLGVEMRPEKGEETIDATQIHIVDSPTSSNSAGSGEKEKENKKNKKHFPQKRSDPHAIARIITQCKPQLKVLFDRYSKFCFISLFFFL